MSEPTETMAVRQEGGVLMAELRYDHEPLLDVAAVALAVRLSHPDAGISPAESMAGLITFPGLTHHFADLPAPASLTVMVTNPLGHNPNAAPHDLSQTWTWAESAEALAATTHVVLVTDLTGRVHRPRARVNAFLAVVRAVVQASRPLGVWWPTSELATPVDSATTDPLGGVVNVRLFTDVGNPGYLVMDTLGLHTLGLPDAQVHFRGLDVGRMAGLLFSLAGYLVEEPDVRPGHTVQGLSSNQRWPVNYQESLIGPQRLVLDLDTGPLE